MVRNGANTNSPLLRRGSDILPYCGVWVPCETIPIERASPYSSSASFVDISVAAFLPTASRTSVVAIALGAASLRSPAKAAASVRHALAAA